MPKRLPQRVVEPMASCEALGAIPNRLESIRAPLMKPGQGATQVVQPAEKLSADGHIDMARISRSLWFGFCHLPIRCGKDCLLLNIECCEEVCSPSRVAAWGAGVNLVIWLASDEGDIEDALKAESLFQSFASSIELCCEKEDPPITDEARFVQVLSTTTAQCCKQAKWGRFSGDSQCPKLSQKIGRRTRGIRG